MTMDDKDIELQGNTVYQSSLVYIMLVLLVLLYSGALVIARLCYLPYSKSIAIPGDMQKAVWSFMIIPSVFAFLGLWFSNIINKKLKTATIMLVFISCAFIAFVPFFYSLYSYGRVSYFTSGFTFFLVSISSSAVLLDIHPPRKAKYKLLAVIPAVLVCLIELAFIYVLYNYVVRSDIFPRIAISMLCPLFCAVAFVISFITAFSSAFSKESIVLNFVASGYSCLCTAFEQMNRRPLRLVLVVLAIICAVTNIYDIIKLIKYKEKENDS